jgi:hypothetical protein
MLVGNKLLAQPLTFHFEPIGLLIAAKQPTRMMLVMSLA